MPAPLGCTLLPKAGVLSSPDAIASICSTLLQEGVATKDEDDTFSAASVDGEVAPPSPFDEQSCVPASCSSEQAIECIMERPLLTVFVRFPIERLSSTGVSAEEERLSSERESDVNTARFFVRPSGVPMFSVPGQENTRGGKSCGTGNRYPLVVVAKHSQLNY